MAKKNLKKQSHKKFQKPLIKAAQLSGAGLQMGVTIYLGYLLGQWLDLKFETTYLEKTITLLSVFLAMYSLIKQAKKIND